MAVFQSFDHVTAEEDLEELRRLAKFARHESCREGIGSGYAVEVGSWMGGTALVLEEVFDRVFCVDTWQGNPNDRLGRIASQHSQEELIETFCRNMGSKLFEGVFPLPGSSTFWSDVWPWPVSLVFIDARHDYEDVKHDILIWRKHVLPGGILCGHDHGSFPGVTLAVNELIPKSELTVNGSVWSTVSR